MLDIVRTRDGRTEVTAHWALSAIRKHLAMDVAYITEFVDDLSVLLEVDAPGLEHAVKPGNSRPLADLYCLHILAGRLPEVMGDASDYELARSMPFTSEVHVGAYMSVPVRRADGSVLGMFCCLSHQPNRSLNDRDLEVMKAFAEIAGEQISRDVEVRKQQDEKRLLIESLIRGNLFTLVFQPIWDFGVDRATGFEVLCRFSPQPYRSPDQWFHDAIGVGLGRALEVAVIRRALEQLPEFPPEVFLSLNASPDALVHGDLEALLEGIDLTRVVVEITEHAPVDDYDLLMTRLAPLKARGLMIAIDDAGAGYSSLRHIIHVRPDIIKLDMALTRNIDTDPARRALASALIHFGRETNCRIVAEGIETTAELDTLRALGVSKGQGYHLGRPMDAARAQALAMGGTSADR